jgi:hypothetical protein
MGLGTKGVVVSTNFDLRQYYSVFIEGCWAEPTLDNELFAFVHL